MKQNEELRRQKAVLDALKNYKGDQVYRTNEEMKERKKEQLERKITRFIKK